MRVIERSEFRDESGQVSLQNRVRGMMRHGLSWFGAMEAQLLVTERLNSVVGSDYTLVRNVLVPGTTAIVPLVLLGPQGVRTIVPTPLRGTYRAKGEEWLTFDSGARRFKRVRPNQQAICIDFSETVLKYFRSQGYDLKEVEPVLVFTNPRTHVDTARPRVRIVMADGIEHLGANLLQLQPIMDQEDIETLVNALIHPKVQQPEETGEPFVPEAVPQVTPSGPPVPVRPRAYVGSPPEAGEVVDSLRRLGAEPEVGEQGPAGPEAEELILEAPFQAADILPTLQKGIRDNVPRIQERVQRLDERVDRLDKGLAVHGARLARRLERRLPPFTRGQWMLLAIMVFFELIVLTIMTLLVLRDVLYA